MIPKTAPKNSNPNIHWKPPENKRYRKPPERKVTPTTTREDNDIKKHQEEKWYRKPQQEKVISKNTTSKHTEQKHTKNDTQDRRKITKTYGEHRQEIKVIPKTARKTRDTGNRQTKWYRQPTEKTVTLKNAKNKNDTENRHKRKWYWKPPQENTPNKTHKKWYPRLPTKKWGWFVKTYGLQPEEQVFLVHMLFRSRALGLVRQNIRTSTWKTKCFWFTCVLLSGSGVGSSKHTDFQLKNRCFGFTCVLLSGSHWAHMAKIDLASYAHGKYSEFGLFGVMFGVAESVTPNIWFATGKADVWGCDGRNPQHCIQQQTLTLFFKNNVYVWGC